MGSKPLLVCNRLSRSTSRGVPFCLGGENACTLFHAPQSCVLPECLFPLWPNIDVPRLCLIIRCSLMVMRVIIMRLRCTTSTDACPHQWHGNCLHIALIATTQAGASTSPLRSLLCSTLAPPPPPCGAHHFHLIRVLRTIIASAIKRKGILPHACWLCPRCSSSHGT